MNLWKILLLTTIWVVFVTPVQGDLIQLKNGSFFKGKIIKADSLVIEIINDKGIQQTISRELILNITWEPGSQPIKIPPMFLSSESLLTQESTINKNEILKAANSLRSFRNQYYAGFALQSVGLIISVLSKDNTVKIAANLLGTISGGILIISAFNSVGTAGDHLDKAIQ